ncbi:DUF927 domain-containing protein [Sphingomonas sp. PB4P5]|uniref:DUF927 domain-containing protein n=1 Tax=Parasphingomonas puruogangriensis TaxID=3096155 RepID=UPI002FCC6C9C
MTLATDTDAFEPITAEEAVASTVPPKKADRVPIVPVPDDAPPCTFKIPNLGGAPKRMWAYRDAAGRLLGYDARFEHLVDGDIQKDVLPVTFCQEGDKQHWRSKALPSPRPLYGLDRLAQRADAPVLIAEGAKSADAAGELLPAYVAMSWSGGSNAISHTSWLSLKGRDVLIWPDRDRHTELSGPEKPYDEQPGTIAAENIIGRLKGVARTIRVLDLADWDCADGWDADDALKEGWDAERASDFIEARSVLIDTDAPGTIMPFNFENREDGLYHVESDTRSQRICGRLKVLAKTRDGAGGSWGLLLEWRDDDGKLHRWAMPKATLAGDGSMVREELLSRGLFVSADSKAKARLLEFLTTVDTPSRAQAVTKVGWAGSAFALPHMTIGDTATDRVIFQNPDAGLHQYGQRGTLEEWQQNVARLAVGNSRLVLMLSAAFVGPCLAPTNEEGGGINIVGPSSCGKTTGLRGATSAWGPPSFMRTWRATGNGLEGVAVQHSETLLCLDELGQLEPKEAGVVAYMLGNGQGKTRSTRSGSSKPAAAWNIMYLSTGEVGLADLAREGKTARNPQAGQEVRILDMPADAGKGMGIFENIGTAPSAENFSRQIKDAAATYYGTAAPAFVEELAPIRDTVGDIIAASILHFVDEFVAPGSDGQVRRAARRLGLIAAAGELATALGILPWPKGEAYGAAGVMFKAWVARRGGTGAAEDRNILERLNSFVEVHGDARFSPIMTDDSTHHRPAINRAGFYRSKTVAGETVREYLILPEPFKEIFAGFDMTRVTTILKQRGFLEPDSKGKSAQSVTLPELGKRRCYVVTAAGLGDAE